MDSNTRDVLMSVLEIVSIIVIGLMAVYQVRANRKIDTVKTDVQTVHSKVDEYRKEINGHMSALLETTKELATAKEKAKGIEENKNKTT